VISLVGLPVAAQRMNARRRGDLATDV